MPRLTADLEALLCGTDNLVPGSEQEGSWAGYTGPRTRTTGFPFVGTGPQSRNRGQTTVDNFIPNGLASGLGGLRGANWWAGRTGARPELLNRKVSGGLFMGRWTRFLRLLVWKAAGFKFSVAGPGHFGGPLALFGNQFHPKKKQHLTGIRTERLLHGRALVGALWVSRRGESVCAWFNRLFPPSSPGVGGSIKQKGNFPGSEMGGYNVFPESVLGLTPLSV